MPRRLTCDCSVFRNTVDLPGSGFGDRPVIITLTLRICTCEQGFGLQAPDAV